jgi:DNA polymerase elongation subunit (family B)
MIYVFDIECYHNFFSVIFKDVNSKSINTFVISTTSIENGYKERNDLVELTSFINDKNKWFIGYNSHYYDNQMLNFISKKYQNLSYETTLSICNQLKELSDDIILNDTKDYKYNLPFRSIDLMRVGNLDQKPLKLVAVNLKWPKIQDLPIEPDAYIKEEEVDLLIKYNLNDVEITESLYNKIYPFIKLRANITRQYGVDVMDESDSGISNRLLEKIFSEALHIPVKELKELQTNRNIIPFKDVIFNDIKFETKVLNDLLISLKKESFQTGVSKFSKKIIFGGVAYQLGIGGIHSNDKPDLFIADEKTKIVDCDIASMYPSLIINHRLSPEHLGDGFIDKYDDIRKKRVDAKHSGDNITADSLKIVLNATYGKTNSDHHWLKDTKVTLQVTVNGQLYLLMLIEQLALNNFQVISANTDGIVTIIPKEREEEYLAICHKWESITNFELEFTEYIKYARRDVNNYITIKPGNKVKLKGEFETETPLNKGFNAPIVSIALYKYYVDGTPIEETIKNHKDIYDFCIARKSDKKFTNEFHYLKDGKTLAVDILQRTNRYFVSKKGGKLYKTQYHQICNIYPEGHDNRSSSHISTKIIDKRSDVLVGHNLTLFNDYFYSDDYDIDYNYYISRANKIKYLIEDPQLKLF